MIKSQKGITMAMVIFLMAAVFIIVAAIFSSNSNKTINVTRSGRADEALQIAEAGINAYIYQLSQDIEFYKNTEGIHIAGSNSEELGLVPSGFDINGLPKVYKETAYKDNNNNTVGYYQIRIVQPSYNKYLEVISTGWTIDYPDIKRTISAKLKNNTFCDYLFFTSNMYTDFYTGITMKGPVFSNNNIHIKSDTSGDPKFESDIIAAGYITTVGNPGFGGKKFEYQPKKNFPAYNKEKIAKMAENDGLYFEGRTCILLDNDYLRMRNENTGDFGDMYYIHKRISKPCTIFVKDGPVFISGTFDGRLTVYSTEDIYITAKDPTNMYSYMSNGVLQAYYTPYAARQTNGILYKNLSLNDLQTGTPAVSDATAMLGLISEKNIKIATTSWPDMTEGIKKYDPSLVITNEIYVCGVLMTAKNIEVEDCSPYDFPADSIYLYGSQACGKFILQNDEEDEREGFSRIMNSYDYRLRYDYPPNFISDMDSDWVIKEWKEVPNY
mgnify:CR=1 FL=1